MRLLQYFLMVVVFLAILCGPAFLVARGLYKRGYPRAPRCLRYILPLQVIAAPGVIVLVDALALYHDLAAVAVTVTAVTSALGAGAMWAIGTLFPGRLL